MQSNNFITIQGFMRTELDLKGNDLLVYAVIYGFSQTKNQRYTGGIKYLEDWTGASRRTVINSIDSLIAMGFIKKEQRKVNGTLYNDYYAVDIEFVINKQGCDNNVDTLCKNCTPPMQKLHTPYAKIAHNKINNKINKNINNNIECENNILNNKNNLSHENSDKFNKDVKKFASAFPKKNCDVINKVYEGIDMARLIECVYQSSFLTNSTNITLSWLLENYSKVISGYYKDYSKVKHENNNQDIVITHNYTDEELNSFFTDLDTLEF